MDLKRAAFARVVAIHNGKGGVLKSSSVANIGAILGEGEQKTLLVDLDPQGNLALDLGYRSMSDEGAGLAETLLAGRPLPEPIQIRPNVYAIPGGEELQRVAAAGEGHLPVPDHDLLVSALAPLALDFDVILLDTPPSSSSPLTSAALGVAHHLLIPTRMDLASIDGLALAARAMDAAKQINVFLELAGVYMTVVAPNATSMQRETREILEELLGGSENIIDAYVRVNEKAAWVQRLTGFTMSEQARLATGVDPWEHLRMGTPPPEIVDDGAPISALPFNGEERIRIEKAPAAIGLTEDYTALTQVLVDKINAHQAELNQLFVGER